MLNCRPYVVSAVVKWSPRHAEKLVAWFDRERHRFPRRMGDQELLVVALYEEEMHHALFAARMHNITSQVTEKTQFLHAAGGKKMSKLRQLKRRFM